jgi:hypothetical protein
MHNARQPQFPPVMDTDSKNSNNYYNKFESLATVCTGDAKRRRASGASPMQYLCRRREASPGERSKPAPNFMPATRSVAGRAERARCKLYNYRRREASPGERREPAVNFMPTPRTPLDRAVNFMPTPRTTLHRDGTFHKRRK